MSEGSDSITAADRETAMSLLGKLYHYRAEVLRVVDGGTFEAMVDRGDSIWSKKTVRILGIDAPEMKGPSKEAGHQARNFLALHLASFGNRLIIKTKKADSSGCSLADCWTSDGYSVAWWMIQNGFAEATDEKGKAK
jgi:micrococcal nuclease